MNVLACGPSGPVGTVADVLEGRERRGRVRAARGREARQGPWLGRARPAAARVPRALEPHDGDVKLFNGSLPN